MKHHIRNNDIFNVKLMFGNFSRLKSSSDDTIKCLKCKDWCFMSRVQENAPSYVVTFLVLDMFGSSVILAFQLTELNEFFHPIRSTVFIDII